jgi:hypothetical protein
VPGWVLVEHCRGPAAPRAGRYTEPLSNGFTGHTVTGSCGGQYTPPKILHSDD